MKNETVRIAVKKRAYDSENLFKYRGDVIHGIVLLFFYDAIHLYLQDLPDKTAVHFQEGAGNQSFIDSFLLPPVGSFKYANLNGLYYLLIAAG